MPSGKVNSGGHIFFGLGSPLNSDCNSINSTTMGNSHGITEKANLFNRSNNLSSLASAVMLLFGV